MVYYLENIKILRTEVTRRMQNNRVGNENCCDDYASDGITK